VEAEEVTVDTVVAIGTLEAVELKVVESTEVEKTQYEVTSKSLSA
jgi:hypothetical protein